MVKQWAGGFDWDGGNRDKCQKHGVSLVEIEAVFAGRRNILADDAHSLVEKRFVAVGIANLARPVLVVFTWRTIDGQLLVRPISARYMHRKEVSNHAKALPQPDE